MCANKVKEMGNQIKLASKTSRKATLSLGARFHKVVDSQQTPSRAISKWARSNGTRERRRLIAPALETLIIGPKVQFLPRESTPSSCPKAPVGTKPKTKRELYGPAILPTKELKTTSRDLGAFKAVSLRQEKHDLSGLKSSNNLGMGALANLQWRQVSPPHLVTANLPATPTLSTNVVMPL